MATFTFETITNAQALAITGADTLAMAGVPANHVSVLYNAVGTITIVAGDRTVEFGPLIAAISLGGRLMRVDGARLVIGDDGPNTTSAPANTSLTDAIYGGAGADSLDGGLGDDLLQGNGGADYIVGGGGRDVIYGGQDDDRIETTIVVSPDPETPFPVGDGGDFAQGNKGNDTIVGGQDADTLLGGQGDDHIYGLDGANILNGNLGNDRMGGAGMLMGEDGADTIVGAGLNDTLLGGAGNDSIVVRGGYADAGAGNDNLVDGNGGGGSSTLLGGDGADTISGLNVSNASASSHTYFGQAGDDSLTGSTWADTISGGDGNDTISGLGGPAAGLDQLTGGAGEDLFILLNTAHILDWQVGDRIDAHFADIGPPTSATYHEIVSTSLDTAYAATRELRPSQGTTWVAAQVGSDVLVVGLSFNSYQASALLVGRTLSDISFDNFI